MPGDMNGPRHVCLLSDHNDGGDCPDYHEWVSLGRQMYLDALGRSNNNGAILWNVIQCNNSECSALLIVREDDYIEWAISGLDLLERSARRDVTTARQDR